MPGIVSKTPYDTHNSIIVPVIASFDSEGHIKPLYVRINECAYKIHSVWLKPDFGARSTFQCKIVDGSFLKPLILTYHHQETTWTMPKVSD